MKGSLLVILSTFAYGSIPMLFQLSFQEGLNVSSILFFRFFIATVIIWIYIFVRKVPYKTTTGHFLYLFVLGGIGFLGTAFFIGVAYTYISGSLATIILFTHPAMISSYEIFILKTGKDARKIFALILSTTGMGCVVWSEDMHINMMGIMLSLLAAICYSFYALGLDERKTKAMHSVAVSGYISFSCLVAYLIQGIIFHNIIIPTTTKSWGYIIFLAIFCTVFATIAFCKGVQIIGPSTSVIISTFEPAVACLTGFFVIGERLTTSIILGGILILSAIFMLQIPEKRIDKIFS
nr:DMT family transporter [Marinisporobacter balticus]